MEANLPSVVDIMDGVPGGFKNTPLCVHKNARSFITTLPVLSRALRSVVAILEKRQPGFDKRFG